MIKIDLKGFRFKGDCLLGKESLRRDINAVERQHAMGSVSLELYRYFIVDSFSL